MKPWFPLLVLVAACSVNVYPPESAPLIDAPSSVQASSAASSGDGGSAGAPSDGGAGGEDSLGGSAGGPSDGGAGGAPPEYWGTCHAGVDYKCSADNEENMIRFDVGGVNYPCSAMKAAPVPCPIGNPCTVYRYDTPGTKWLGYCVSE